MAKGKTNNPNGRPRGRPNKVTAEMKIWIQELINQNRKQLETDLQALDPKDRWQVIEKLMTYTIPKMQSVQANISLEDLSEEQLDMIAKKMLNSISQ